MTSEEKMLELAEETRVDAEVAFVLVASLLGYLRTCEERNYKISPTTIKMYATRIKERLCADEEKDDV